MGGVRFSDQITRRKGEAKRRKAHANHVRACADQCAQFAPLICCAAARHSRGRARLPALHRGTRHRLLPRWLSPRTGFPQSTAKRVFCPLAAQRFELSTLRADRSFCRPTGDPGPPGSGSHPSARGHRIPLRFPKVPSRKAPLVSWDFIIVTELVTICQVKPALNRRPSVARPVQGVTPLYWLN